MDPEECECWTGTPRYSWDWTPGAWRRGEARGLEWRTAKSEPLYAVEDRLSFLIISDWVKEKYVFFLFFSFLFFSFLWFPFLFLNVFPKYPGKAPSSSPIRSSLHL